MKRIALLIMILIHLLAAYGQVENSGKDSFLLLEAVELRAIRASQNSPFTRTDLYKKEIAKQNLGQDLPFLLNQVPNVVIHSDAGNGFGYTGIRIRGTDASRINVTLNGIPFNDAESQGSFFVDLPDLASSISSIQVQRGVGTSSNGPGAFGATINISTNEVNEQPFAEFNNSYGSFNTWKHTIKTGSGILGDHFTTDFRLSRITSDGYIDRATSYLRSFYFSTAYLGKNSSLRFNLFSGKEKTYQAWYGVSESDLNSRRTINYAGTEKSGEPYSNETDNYDQDHYQLFYNHKPGDQLKFNTSFFYVRGKGYYEQYKANQVYRDYQLEEPVTGNTVITNTDLVRQLWLDNHFYGNIFSIHYQPGNSEIIFGGGWNRYNGNHYGDVVWAEQGLSLPGRYYQHDAEKTDFTLYLKQQSRIGERFNVFYDLQYRRVNYEINGFRDNPELQFNNKYRLFNPKAGLSFSDKYWKVYGSFAVGRKEPNRDDFEAGMEQSPRPENLYDLELGIEKRKKSFNVGAVLYYMHYRDQLVLTGKINDVGAYTRTNIPNSYRLGIELTGSFILTEWLNASGSLALSRNKVNDFISYADDYDNGGQKIYMFHSTDIAFSPGIIAGLSINVHPLKNTELALLSKYTGKQYLDNTQNELRKLDAYFVQDMRISYSFSKRILKETSLIFQVNNLLNELYEPNGYTYSYFSGGKLVSENFYYPMAGRNFVVGFNLKL